MGKAVRRGDWRLVIGDWGRSGEVVTACLAPFGLAAEVEVEEGGVQLAAQQEAPILVPPERRAGPTAVCREGFEVPGGVGEFENAGEKPVYESFPAS